MGIIACVPVACDRVPHPDSKAIAKAVAINLFENKLNLLTSGFVSMHAKDATNYPTAKKRRPARLW